MQMRSSCATGALLNAVIAQHSSSSTNATARLYTSNFGKAKADAEPLDAEQPSDHSDRASKGPLSSSAPSQPPQRYRRRSSDPQTPRERADFRRDYKYAKHRPLPDAPWRQLKTKTYLDDAERLYGRKETWHTVEDATLREKLVAILQDYLRDTLAAARLEAKDARKYAFLCSTAAKHYRAHVSSGAFGLPEGLQEWARGVVAGRASSPSTSKSSTTLSTTPEMEEGDAHAEGVSQGAGASFVPSHTAAADEHHGDSAAASPSQEEHDAARFREERRRRGAEANLANTVAMAGLPDADSRHSPHSAFPFLRQRAVEKETTLDPSLVDWTAKYFSEDDASTFAEPPRLRAGMLEDEEGTVSDREATGDGRQEEGASPLGILGAAKGRRPSGFAPPMLPVAHRSASMHARHRLGRTLRDHENRHRATFDAEGIYYKVRRQSEVEERAPKPQQVRASDLEPLGRQVDVVKVPWSVAAKAKAQGYSSDTLRAKERLIRLTRGEDPETIP
ncbi:conserved hypothetical protein [Leishmania major strain Friedlin]|uniref:Uncharacterized protein n=1 Tax=Leishmania major TaxID=5664 RepID=Q4Q8I7_LEIMA|nr:conserved hypothetical protein [Leishmania major strain Friedlin]CAG9577184.1 hypothetical_protein_-_conserved [Leishmania major strain Friedlin]CAJ05170.1 conserved hypothetical protein [Leishmania major strain Friedlin]|eukprot:XP_001684361.1 conserved hypothetical protein [Leishmania major strain Friedlin]